MLETYAWADDALETGRYAEPVALRAGPEPRANSNRRPACYYGLGAAACLLVAFARLPWTLPFLWPCVGLGLISLAYFGAGPVLFRKQAGQLTRGTRISFGPYLFFNTIGYRLLVRRKACYVRLTKGVYVGRLLADHEASAAIRDGVTAVLDLTAEYSESAPFRAIPYRNVPILDLTLPTADHLQEAVQFIAWHAARGTVYIHCALGCCRAPSIAAAYLLASRQVTSGAEAIAAVRRVRSHVVLPRGLEELLNRTYGKEPWVRKPR